VGFDTASLVNHHHDPGVRAGAGRGDAILPEPTSSHAKCRKTRTAKRPTTLVPAFFAGDWVHYYPGARAGRCVRRTWAKKRLAFHQSFFFSTRLWYFTSALSKSCCTSLA